MNEETKHVISKQLIRLEKLIEETELDIKELTRDIMQKYVNLATYNKQYIELKQDLNA